MARLPLLLACLSSLAVAQPAPAPRTLKLAAPNWKAVELKEDVATFITEHFAQELARRGVEVITPSEIQAMLGLERQRQLLGCDESSTTCMAELADALGTEGLITGNLARFGPALRANVKIIRSSNGEVLSTVSVRAADENALLEELTLAAEEIAPELFRKTGTVPSKRPSVVRVSDARPWGAGGWNPPRNLVTFGLPALASARWQFEYERVLSRWVSAYARPELLFWPAPDTAAGSNPPNGYYPLGVGITVGGRVWLGGDAPRGMFVAADAGAAIGSARVIDGGAVTDRQGPTFFGGLSVGFAFLVFDRIPLSFGLGAELRSKFGVLTTNGGTDFISARLSVGYAF